MEMDGIWAGMEMAGMAAAAAAGAATTAGVATEIMWHIIKITPVVEIVTETILVVARIPAVAFK